MLAFLAHSPSLPRPPHPLRIAFAVALLAASLLALAGCGRYQLGRHAEPPFRSIYIAPVANAAFAPQAQAILTQQIREALLHDGLVQVATIDHADAVLEVVLRDFQRTVAATRIDDTGLAEKLRLELRADCTLTDSRSGRVYFRNRAVSATADAFPEDRPQQAEFQAMPVLTHNLARRIAYEILQVW
jgi:hypothetical protein